MKLHRIGPSSALLLVLTPAVAAHAADKSCGVAYEEAQVARSESRLRAARDELSSCMRAECPSFVRSDCTRWLNEVELALPSVVLVAKSGASDLEDVRVFLDGAPFLSRIDGKAVPVDPGRHLFRFEAEGRQPREVDVLIREGDKNRAVEADFPAPTLTQSAPSPAPTGVKSSARVGALPYALFGVGALGLAGFTTFALLGNGTQHDLERSCAPDCQPDRVRSLHTKYVLADASLALGVIAIGAASYLLLSAPPARQVTAGRPTRSPRVGFVIASGAKVGTLDVDF